MTFRLWRCLSLKFAFISDRIFGEYYNGSGISEKKEKFWFLHKDWMNILLQQYVIATPFCLLHPVLDFILWNVETYQMEKVLNSKGQPVLN